MLYRAARLLGAPHDQVGNSDDDEAAGGGGEAAGLYGGTDTPCGQLAGYIALFEFHTEQLHQLWSFSCDLEVASGVVSASVRERTGRSLARLRPPYRPTKLTVFYSVRACLQRKQGILHALRGHALLSLLGAGGDAGAELRVFNLLQRPALRADAAAFLQELAPVGPQSARDATTAVPSPAARLTPILNWPDLTLQDEARARAMHCYRSVLAEFPTSERLDVNTWQLEMSRQVLLALFPLAADLTCAAVVQAAAVQVRALPAAAGLPCLLGLSLCACIVAPA